VSASGASPETEPRANVLVVDDQPANLLALEAVLEPLGQRIVRATSGEEALSRLREHDFAVVLLDVMMPGIDGLDTADMFRAQTRGREVPIIFMTAGDIAAIEGYRRGAVDVLRKPIDGDAVRAKVSVFVELFLARQQIGEHAARLAVEERASQERIFALLNASLDGVIGMDSSGHITEFNGAAEAMFGHSRAAVLGSSVADVLIPPQLREAHRRGLARYLATGETQVLDTRIEVTALRADGTQFPIELAIRRVGTDGLPTFLGYARDLTARRAAEQERLALLERERLALADAEIERARLHSLLMQVPAFICIQRGPDHVYEFVNARYRELVSGAPTTDSVGEGRSASTEVSDRALLDRVFATGEPISVPELRTPLGLYREGTDHGYLNVSYHPLFGSSGKPEGVMTFGFDVTDQVRARRELEVAEAKFRRIFESNMIGFLFTSPDGRVFDANDYALTMLGFDRADLATGRIQWHDITPSEYAAVSANALEQLRWADVTAPFEKEYLRKDGRRVPAVVGSARLPRGSEDAEFVTFVLDISDRKAMEVERERVDKARRFLARASEAFASSLDYEATLQTVVRLAVPHIADWCAVDIVGNDSSEVVRLAVSHVDAAKVALAEELRRRYPPDPEAPRGVSHVLRTGLSELYEEIPDATLEAVAQDAEHLRILRELGLRSAIIAPIVAHGRTLGAITFVAAKTGRRYDRTDLATAEDLARRAAIAIENARLYRASKRAEARNRFLAEATEALSSTLDYTLTLEAVARLAVPVIAEAAAVYRLEEDGAIRLIALAAEDPSWEGAARELDTLLPLRIEQQDRMLPRVVRTGRAELLPDLPDAVRETWGPTSRAEELVRALSICSYMVVPLIVRGNVLGALALTASASGRRFESDDLALAEELARRAGLAMENAQLYREAKDANRLKDEFLATVSHELRTPLTAILGWLHLLKTGRPSQVARAIETIERNAQAQARIVDDVLDVSRVITGKLRLEVDRINLADVLSAAVDTVRPAAEAKEIELFVSLDPSAAETAGDAARLQQVAWNLLSNAIKFTPKGGRIEVRLERSGSDARVSVSDNGEGIREDFLLHVFERFRQGDSTPTRVYGGLGLGLAIVRHLVELHGGRVIAESDGEGRGATFTVTLPIIRSPAATQPSPEATRATPAEPSRRPLEGVHVLVVDDEADARDFLAALLEQHGAKVTAVPSARAAQAAMDQERPDVLVSDIAMPGEDGYALIRAIRATGLERGFWFPAIALTARIRPEDRYQALSAGYQVHLTKPVDAAALVMAIVDLGKGP
jgi:PAS domain S-box-containing protein